VNSAPTEIRHKHLGRLQFKAAQFFRGGDSVNPNETTFAALFQIYCARALPRRPGRRLMPYAAVVAAATNLGADCMPTGASGALGASFTLSFAPRLNDSRSDHLSATVAARRHDARSGRPQPN